MPPASTPKSGAGHRLLRRLRPAARPGQCHQLGEHPSQPLALQVSHVMIQLVRQRRQRPAPGTLDLERNIRLGMMPPGQDHFRARGAVGCLPRPQQRLDQLDRDEVGIGMAARHNDSARRSSSTLTAGERRRLRGQHDAATPPPADPRGPRRAPDDRRPAASLRQRWPAPRLHHGAWPAGRDRVSRDRSRRAPAGDGTRSRVRPGRGVVPGMPHRAGRSPHPARAVRRQPHRQPRRCRRGRPRSAAGRASPPAGSTPADEDLTERTGQLRERDSDRATARPEQALIG